MVQRLDRTKVPILDRELHASIIKTGEGMVEYVDGVDDASIAEMLGCSKSSVAAYRLKVFGRINKPISKEHSNVGYVELLAKYEEILERVSYIEKELGITVKKLNGV